MSFSAHRPGRFGSDGRIEFTTTAETEPMYLSDLRAAREAEDVDSQPEADAEAPTVVIPAPVAEAPERIETPEPVAPEPQPAAVQPELAEPEPVEPEPEPGESEPAPVAPEPEPVDVEPIDIEPEPVGRPRRGRRAGRPGRRIPILRRLAVLGGADGHVLDEVPTETSRFVQMFFVLAGTALVSALSMTFALITGVRISVWLAVPLALVWALIIFNLDRFLTSTMRATRNIWRLIGLAIPRVIMAALIGIVVAEPLVLQVFHNDIARQVTSTNLTQAQSDQDAVTNGPEKEALDEASAALAALQNQAATGIVAGTDSTSAETVAAQATVDQLTQQLADQQTVIDTARALYQCELTGEGAGTVSGCTGVAGDGTSAEAAEAQLEAAQSAYDDLAAQLQTAQAALTAANSASTEAAATSAEQNKQAAEDQLPAAQATYDAALAAYNERAAEVASGNAEAVGLLSQITALEELSEQEPTLAWAHWLIAALFFMIELLPVLVKVLTSFGDPSLYEKADAMRRQVSLDRVTARTFRDRAAVITSESAAS
ncbi:MAG: DUF4407 domain-containing protein [Microbacterium sp.]|uniref:DUF4407 domain-containing protein n=1 Tax=Microbacterium sp. TaxID=51671 RepID=UPI0039E61416